MLTEFTVIQKCPRLKHIHDPWIFFIREVWGAEPLIYLGGGGEAPPQGVASAEDQYGPMGLGPNEHQYGPMGPAQGPK